MESLESKLDRLPAEQRREVEDFVDFLIQRAEGIRVTVELASHDAIPSAKSVAPPLIAPDPVMGEDPALPVSRGYSPRPLCYRFMRRNPLRSSRRSAWVMRKTPRTGSWIMACLKRLRRPRSPLPGG